MPLVALATEHGLAPELLVAALELFELCRDGGLVFSDGSNVAEDGGDIDTRGQLRRRSRLEVGGSGRLFPVDETEKVWLTTLKVWQRGCQMGSNLGSSGSLLSLRNSSPSPPSLGSLLRTPCWRWGTLWKSYMLSWRTKEPKLRCLKNRGSSSLPTRSWLRTGTDGYQRAD
jgi:hypothetical protein